MTSIATPVKISRCEGAKKQPKAVEYSPLAGLFVLVQSPRTGKFRRGDYSLDGLAFCGSIGIHIRPVPACQRSFHRFVFVPFADVAPQPIAVSKGYAR
jgi:hypothetical protein